MTKREKAIEELLAGKSLSTSMLKPLGIPFEVFLKFAQLSKEEQGRNLIAFAKALKAKDSQ